jgi:hypothetical protein
MVAEERVCQVPYVTCRLVAEECIRQVPTTTCTLEPYCVTFKVCRQVPMCVPVCEPSCQPPCLPEACSFKSQMHGWLAHTACP